MTIARIRRWQAGLAVLLVLIASGVAWQLLQTSKSPDDYVNQGFEAIKKQDWPVALRAANGLKGRSQYASEERLFRGIWHLKSGRPSSALTEFRLLEPNGLLREPALLFTGEAFYRLDQFDQARQMFAMLSAEQPGHAEAHRWLAAIAYDLGDMNRTMDELEIVNRLAPDDYRPLLLKGQILFDLERFEDAAAAYTQAIALSPPQEVQQDAIPTLARAQMETRDYAAALESLRRAPSTAQTLALQAECQLSLGNVDDANRLLTEAQDLDAEQPDLLRLYGRMRLDSGHAAEAIAAFRAVLEQTPQDHETRHQLAQALRLAGQAGEADREARQSLRIISLKEQLAKLTIEAIDHPQDDTLRERMARICDELDETELAAMWRKAAAACRKKDHRSPASSQGIAPRRNEAPE